jgi:hypothetical protein
MEAYRWLLGREPHSDEEIQRHLNAASDREQLRRRILRLDELRHDMALLTTTGGKGVHEGVLDLSIPRLVFLHIPKTGGTSLRRALQDAVGKDRVCTEVHNLLWSCTGAELFTSRLFSGHFDRRCLTFIPGRQHRIVTMLRDPRSRLISLYQFMRSYTERFSKAHKQALAIAARRLPFGEFLDAALRINPAAVDNTYLRAFGAELPSHHWDQRAERGALKLLSEFDRPVDDILEDAKSFLSGISCVGILESYERSAAAIFSAFGLEAPDQMDVRNRTSELASRSQNFAAVEPFEITASDEERIERLTRYDRVLYTHGKLLFESSSSS